MANALDKIFKYFYQVLVIVKAEKHLTQHPFFFNECNGLRKGLECWSVVSFE